MKSLGAFLSDFERLEILASKELLSWSLVEKLITGFNVFVSNLFDSVVCVNGIVRRDTSWSLHYSTLFWLLGTIEGGKRHPTSVSLFHSLCYLQVLTSLVGSQCRHLWRHDTICERSIPGVQS